MAGKSRIPTSPYDITARPRQQSIEPALRRFRENGSIVITSTKELARTGNRLGGRIVMYIMPAHEGIDIDTEYDLWMADQWLRGQC